MKTHFLIFSILLLSSINVAVANDTPDTDSNLQSVKIDANLINIHPQPLLLGDAEISLKIPERIVSTSIYTYTGERKAFQVHDSATKVIKIIPYELESGEYLLFIETENGYGIRKVYVQ